MNSRSPRCAAIDMACPTFGDKLAFEILDDEKFLIV